MRVAAWTTLVCFVLLAEASADEFVGVDATGLRVRKGSTPAYAASTAPRRTTPMV